MKLRLTQQGFKTYNGQMGVVFFENGLSTADVLPVDAVRMAAVMGCEWEDGTPANVSQIYLDNMKTPAPQVRETQQGTDAAPQEVKAVEQAPVEQSVYTAEELGALADKGGIAALRAIAEPLGIKGNSIQGLIESLVKAGATKVE